MIKNLFKVLSISLIFVIVGSLYSQTKSDYNQTNGSFNSFVPENLPWSTRLINSFIIRHPNAVTYDEFMTKNKWNYEQGVMLEAMRKMYEMTKDQQYYEFIKNNIDQYVDDEGKIKTYKYSSFNLDNINTGRALLFLYEKTKNEKYKIAADTLRKQLQNQPRTRSGGFWHKKIYPYQMWLDGLFMAEPFYSQYSFMFSQNNYDDIFNQFELAYKNTLDSSTGLLYHAWNENKEQKWADKTTGKSPNFWGRSIGWYLMAIVEVLDYVPKQDLRRKDLINILQNVSNALLNFRDCKTGLWYQVIDMPEREGNYLEASCASMFTYVFAKGANKGYLPLKFLNIAEETFKAIIKYDVKIDENGFVNLYYTCSSAGLGGHPYRNGSFAYYISEPQRTNDFKGYGPLIYSVIELEKAGALSR